MLENELYAKLLVNYSIMMIHSNANRSKSWTIEAFNRSVSDLRLFNENYNAVSSYINDNLRVEDLFGPKPALDEISNTVKLVLDQTEVVLNNTSQKSPSTKTIYAMSSLMKEAISELENLKKYVERVALADKVNAAPSKRLNPEKSALLTPASNTTSKQLSNTKEIVENKERKTLKHEQLETLKLDTKAHPENELVNKIEIKLLDKQLSEPKKKMLEELKSIALNINSKGESVYEDNYDKLQRAKENHKGWNYSFMGTSETEELYKEVKGRLLSYNNALKVDRKNFGASSTTFPEQKLFCDIEKKLKNNNLSDSKKDVLGSLKELAKLVAIRSDDINQLKGKLVCKRIYNKITSDCWQRNNSQNQNKNEYLIKPSSR